MAENVFGAVISIKDNVSSVFKKAKDSSSGFRGEVEKAKKELERFDKKKVKAKEIKLKNTAAYKALDGVSKKMKPLTKKVITLKAKEEIAVGKIKKVARELGKVKDNKVVKFAVSGAEKVTKALGKAALVGTAAALTTVTAAAGTAVVSAVNFQSQMQNVGTLLDGDVNGTLQKMGADLKKVSVSTGQDLSDLASGLYDVVSAFGESSESVKQVEIASKAAKAGNASTSESVELLSAVTKGYGDTSAAAMQKAADLAFQTVKLGQTTYPELASSIGQVVPLAATLKVSQEELFGATATLTGVTGGTSEVMTQLKATMEAFLSPSTEMEKKLKKLGYVVQVMFYEMGHKAGIDEIMAEAKVLYEGMEKYVTGLRVDEIIRNMEKMEVPYNYLSGREKAMLFQFQVEDSNYNLKLYSAVMKAVGIRQSMDEMYEDYQRIYDKTVKMQMEKETERKNEERGRGR